MKLALVGLGFLMVTAACSSEALSNGDLGDEGPATAEDQAALTSGKVSLRIPLLDFDGKPLSHHNAKLKAAGLGTFPESVEIEGGANGDALPNATKKFDDAQKLIDKAFDKLKLSIDMRQLGEPFEYKTNDPKTSICYKGNPKVVVALIESVAGNVFSDQLFLKGWRHRHQKEFMGGTSEDDEKEFPAIWRNWRGEGDAILTISSSSDGGEEMNVSLIPKCSN